MQIDYGMLILCGWLTVSFGMVWGVAGYHLGKTRK
jgi:hypothetical protein